MGSCLSKKNPNSNPISKSVILNNHYNNNIPETIKNDLKIASQTLQNNVNVQVNRVDEKGKEDEVEKEITAAKKKKEVFVIHHRKSNERSHTSDGSVPGSVSNGSDPESVGRNLMEAVASGQVVRTSSCTKEEVDAILIQCGRLSRSSSGNGGNGRRYSGSKRSFDFDREGEGNGEGVEEGEGRLRRRESRGGSRRTPGSSRERGEMRSGSRERNGNGRRVSRSPGRRSDSPMSHHGNGNGNAGNGNNTVGSGRPGKLVSVPATVTSLSVDKGNCGNGGENGNGNVKRVLVIRNVGSPRSQSPAKGNGRAQSPAKGNGNGRCQSPAKGNGNERSNSPARGNTINGNGGGGGQLSRNGSRKTEHSPFRRTPLSEIDLNSLPFQPLANKRPLVKGKEIEEDGLVVKQSFNSVVQNKYAADAVSGKAPTQGTHRRTRSRGSEGYEITKTNYCRVNDIHTPNPNQISNNQEKDQLNSTEYDTMVTPLVLSTTDTLKLPQTLVRSRSSRRSRDFDINVDALVTPTIIPTPTPTPATNYTSLLLQDIQKFHQNKNSNANSNSNSNAKSDTVAVPPCLTKACSILEAVSDLNSSTGSNSSFAFTNDRRVSPPSGYSVNSCKKRAEPFVESEVKVKDDLLEPSFEKYVT